MKLDFSTQQILPLSPLQTIQHNKVLAESITAKWKLIYTKIGAFCESDSFYIDPIAHIINAMIKSGRDNDGNQFMRIAVIRAIPEFLDTLASLNYWKSFAVTYFKCTSENLKIMEVFERSITSKKFITELDEAIKSFKFELPLSGITCVGPEYELRCVLTVFESAKELKPYQSRSEFAAIDKFRIENEKLSLKLMEGKGRHIQAICLHKNFAINPTDHLIREMIERYVGRSSPSDYARAFIIGSIPGFIEKFSSLRYLRTFAVSYFKDNPNKIEISQIFEKSLLSEAFQKDLQTAVDHFKTCIESKGDFHESEKLMREVLTIFYQSKMLEEYESTGEVPH
jgi:hypothetical protein